MKKYLSLLISVLVICFSSSTLNALTSKITDRDISDYIDAEISKLIDNKSTKGAIVSIVKGGKVILCKGYGYADEKNGIRSDGRTTAFRIGSVSKTFVSLAIMQLVEQGMLDMDEPVTKYLESDFPGFKYPITMRNLLTHTAGFEEMISGLEVETAEEVKPLREFVRNCRPNQFFKPGEVSAYSNYGISLAGYVIERLAGKPFYDYAEEKIFKPLSMNNTTYKLIRKAFVSKAYGPLGTEHIDGEANDYPSASATATAQDMAAYMNFLLSDIDSAIIKNKWKLEMFRQQYTMDKELPGYGYVWPRFDLNGHIFYSHSGASSNFISNIGIFPDHNLGIFISCNQMSNFGLEDIVHSLAERLYGVKKEKEAYTGGKDIRDISGYYMKARHAFKSPDKFTNFFFGVPVHITGNTKDGFMLNGEKLMPVGEDYYSGKKFGSVKFIEKEGKLYFSLERYPESFFRVPWYEGIEWQLFAVVFFVITAFVGFVVSVIELLAAIRYKRGKRSIFIHIPYIAVFAVFASMVTRFVLHMQYLTETFGGINSPAGMEQVVSWFRAGAFTIAVFGILGLLSAVYFWIRKRSLFIRVFYTIWSIATTIFISWLIQLNLIG